MFASPISLEAKHERFTSLVAEASTCVNCPAMCERAAVLSHLNGPVDARVMLTGRSGKLELLDELGDPATRLLGAVSALNATFDEQRGSCNETLIERFSFLIFAFTLSAILISTSAIVCPSTSMNLDPVPILAELRSRFAHKFVYSQRGQEAVGIEQSLSAQICECIVQLGLQF